MPSTNRFRLFIRFLLLSILLAACTGGPGTPSPMPTPAETTTAADVPELEEDFQGFTGAFILYDLNKEHYLRYNPERCAQRFLPASTFKIVNSLIGLETGVVPDENHVIEWDGTQYEISTWNQNHTLKTAFRNSVVWYYQELARRGGREKMQYYVDAVGYGNQDIAGNIDSFWLDGAIRISADEQVELLKQLYQGKLPFSTRSMEIVREIMILEDAARYRLSGKTGSGKVGAMYIGWFVGYLEIADNVYFFATNVESSGPEANGLKAKKITYNILKELELLPSDSVPATPAPETPAPGTILFEEDFEDDMAQDFTYMIGNWNILLDEAGNKVLDGDNRLKSNEPLSFGFGSREWTDYAAEYDIRMRNPTADVRLNVRNSNQGYYVHRLSLLYSHMALSVTSGESTWVLLKSRTYEFSRGVWYHVRLEVQGETLRVFVNEKLEIETTDSQVHAGDLDFGVMAPTRVQLDNIRVTVLPPYNAEEDLYQDNLKEGATGVPLSPDGN